jgi:hypothetical protein
LVQHGIISLFSFGWRYIPDRLQKSSAIEPVYPFQDNELDRFEAPPWSASMNDLGLVKAVDRFCEGVVVAVADASDRWLDTCFCQSLRIAN